VVPCAGAYVSGAAGINECPAGSARIETEAACRTAAAAAAGKSVGSPFLETDPRYPRGCYYVIVTSSVYFNADAVGAGRPNAGLLCTALVTTGMPRFARVCTARHSRAVCAIHRYTHMYE
jgi:hypothetical protein